MPADVLALLFDGIVRIEGWGVKGMHFELDDGTRADDEPSPDAMLVLQLKRKGPARCPDCGSACRKTHKTGETQRWQDMPWGTHPVWIEATPVRVECKRCSGTPVELLPWADPLQLHRKTRRLVEHEASLRERKPPSRPRRR